MFPWLTALFISALKHSMEMCMSEVVLKPFFGVGMGEEFGEELMFRAIPPSTLPVRFNGADFVGLKLLPIQNIVMSQVAMVIAKCQPLTFSSPRRI